MIFDQSFWLDAAYTFMIFSGVIVLVSSIFVYWILKNRLRQKSTKRRKK